MILFAFIFADMRLQRECNHFATCTIVSFHFSGHGAVPDDLEIAEQFKRAKQHKDARAWIAINFVQLTRTIGCVTLYCGEMPNKFRC